jgi:hypothetical protein
MISLNLKPRERNLCPKLRSLKLCLVVDTPSYQGSLLPLYEMESFLYCIYVWLGGIVFIVFPLARHVVPALSENLFIVFVFPALARHFEITWYIHVI